jgi:hypothetical protein
MRDILILFVHLIVTVVRLDILKSALVCATLGQ